MEYKLALKLKKAGFPQKTYFKVDLNKEDAKTYTPCEPSLSELIEACGEGQRSLDEEDINEWVAKKHYGFDKPPEIGYGKTPEIAVAILWLALKEKKK